MQGHSIATAYRWKDTIGDVADRKSNQNFWGYHQSYGLGFEEYFQYCEDIGAEPLPVLNVGMAFQDSNDFVPLSDLGAWIQDALDLIEYANGDVSTMWGSLRARNGHPAPFNLKYLEIGNEQWGYAYFERYKLFAAAIRAKYPKIQLIFSSGPLPSGPIFDGAWAQVTNLPVDLVDEHYYMPAEWFLSNTHRYDSYDRKGPAVYLGEYAAQVDGRRNNLYAALAEAAFMTGLERNGDIVKMASYAPLLARSGDTQWTPDLIWFNKTSMYGTPSYYVQKMFSHNLSSSTLPSSLAMEKKKPVDNSVAGGIGLGTWATHVQYRNLKVTDSQGNVLYQPHFQGDLPAGWTVNNGDWQVDGNILEQNSGGTGCMVTYQNEKWQGITYTLQARKTSGAEGMLILFGVQGSHFYWWNIGGWGNTRTAIEKGTASGRSIIGPSVPMRIDTDRWYDIRIELGGGDIRCYLDDQLVEEVKAPKVPESLYTHVGRGPNGEIIVKAVNMEKQPLKLTLHLKNAPVLKPQGVATVLWSSDLTGENSFEDPKKISPEESTFNGVSPDFDYTLRPQSVTILKLFPRTAL